MNNGKNFIYETCIQNKHLDVYGHMNNSKYLVLLEEARWNMLGLHEVTGPAHVKSSGQGPIIRELKIKFKRELLLGDKIQIHTQIGERKNPYIFYLEQTIYKPQDLVASEVVIEMGMLDIKQRRLLKLKDLQEVWKKAFNLDH